MTINPVASTAICKTQPYSKTDSTCQPLPAHTWQSKAIIAQPLEKKLNRQPECNTCSCGLNQANGVNTVPVPEVVHGDLYSEDRNGCSAYTDENMRAQLLVDDAIHALNADTALT